MWASSYADEMTIPYAFIAAAGETADRYNGQQSDLWDAQKDMALAALRAIMATAVQTVTGGRR